jgi:hypothetical protein
MGKCKMDPESAYMLKMALQALVWAVVGLVVLYIIEANKWAVATGMLLAWGSGMSLGIASGYAKGIGEWEDACNEEGGL